MTARELATADLRALLAEIAEVRDRLRRLVDEIAGLDPGPAGDPPRPILALIGVDLHSYYTQAESILERVVVALEGRVPQGAGSHAKLLRHACRAIDGIRPALIRPELHDGLDELRRFRHFFRHTYALDLSHAKLRRALDPFPTVAAEVDQDMGSCATFLTKLIDEIEG